MKVFLTVLILLASSLTFSAGSLDPKNSKIDPISFSHQGREYFIGIWEFVLFGDSFAMVTDRGDGTFIYVGRFDPVRENDAEGHIESAGGAEAFLLRSIDQWNTELSKPERVLYPGWKDYLDAYLSFDDATGQLTIY